MMVMVPVLLVQITVMLALLLTSVLIVSINSISIMLVLVLIVIPTVPFVLVVLMMKTKKLVSVPNVLMEVGSLKMVNVMPNGPTIVLLVPSKILVILVPIITI